VARFAVQLHADLDTFSPVPCMEGQRRGAEAALALLRELRPSVGTASHFGAYIRLRDFAAHAGAAASEAHEGPGSRPDADRAWAGREALGVLVSVALLGLQRLDLDRLERDVLGHLAHDEAFWNRYTAQQKADFVKRMAEGRRQAADRRARGGAA
jgi:hypothetical protein